MKQILLLLTLAAATLMGADATGTWTGSLTLDDGNPRPAHLVLKQEGTKLTGTAGPDAGEQHPISNGKAEDGNLTFEVVRESGPTMKFALKQDGDQISGKIERERDGQVQTAKIEVKRQK